MTTQYAAKGGLPINLCSSGSSKFHPQEFFNHMLVNCVLLIRGKQFQQHIWLLGSCTHGMSNNMSDTLWSVSQNKDPSKA